MKRCKGEVPIEIIGVCRALRALRVGEFTDDAFAGKRVLDIVGTGGDCSNTFNVSTGSALLLAACDVPVAKHGNRSSSSLCGAADVLNALNVNVNSDSATICRCLHEANFAFCFAPNYYPAVGAISEIRKSLGLPTIFNLVGPLLNPMRPDHYVIGVYNPLHLDIIGAVLLQIKAKRSLVVHCAGLDELAPIGISEVLELTNRGDIKKWTFDPFQFGFEKCSMADLKGGDAATNASILSRAFEGESGPVSETLVLNAGMALWVYEDGDISSLGSCFDRARQVIRSGKVAVKLKEVIKLSNLT